MSESLYLSRIHLPARSRDTQRLLADCHAMHRFVMRQVPEAATETARAELGVLYRVENAEGGQSIAVMLQSAAEPRWAFELPGVRAEGPRPLDTFLDGIADGRRYRFRLRANPTRRVSARATRETDIENGRIQLERPESRGKRVAIRGEDQRMAWLERKALAAGFQLVTGEVRGGVDPASESRATFTGTRLDLGQPLRDRAARLTLETCLFEGLLDVADSAKLAAAVREGVGGGKAFGCGLLSLAPAAAP
jgi:CRISPR system Cascade subunit CasE